MTERVQERRPEGDAARHYEEALRLEQEAGELVRHGLTQDRLEEAERLRALAKKEWKAFWEATKK